MQCLLHYGETKNHNPSVWCGWNQAACFQRFSKTFLADYIINNPIYIFEEGLFYNHIYHSLSKVISIIDSILIIFWDPWHYLTSLFQIHFLLTSSLINCFARIIFLSFFNAHYGSAHYLSTRKNSPRRNPNHLIESINWAIYLEDNCGHYLDTISINSICVWGALTRQIKERAGGSWPYMALG